DRRSHPAHQDRQGEDRVARRRALAGSPDPLGLEIRPGPSRTDEGPDGRGSPARLHRAVPLACGAQLRAEGPVIAPSSAVSVREVSKWFGRRVLALDRVSLEIPAGSLFGLLGPNGAGKTTLFSVAADFLKASGGAIEILGIDS